MDFPPLKCVTVLSIMQNFLSLGKGSITDRSTSLFIVQRGRREGEGRVEV